MGLGECFGVYRPLDGPQCGSRHIPWGLIRAPTTGKRAANFSLFGVTCVVGLRQCTR